MFYHDISPELLSLGALSIRWYGLFFASGFLLTYLFTRWIFKKEGHPLTDLDSLAIYLFLGMVIGARLGEVLFYNPVYFFSYPLDIIKVWEGGLSSHGAAIGVLVSYLIWLKKHKIKFSKYIDLLVIGMPITAGFVRIGNFFNSEIIGKATNGSWGVVFQQLGEDFPRHPTQLYEADTCFTIFIILFVIYQKYYKKLPPLFMMSLFIFLYFTTRFIIEFWKEKYSLPTDFPLTMGQILSIIPVLFAIGYFIYIYKNGKKQKNPSN